MQRKQLQSNGILLLTALIWGLAFVAQSVAMDYVKPFTFNGVRSILGGVVLLPVIWIIKKCSTSKKETLSLEDVKQEKGFFHSVEFIGGVVIGIALFVASNLQQFGVMYSTPGKAGFLTALYILLVPIMGLFLGKKVMGRIWACVAMALVGVFLLCVTQELTIQMGDVLLILCAIGFSVHILAVDHYSPKANGTVMSCVQFFVCGALSLLCMLFFEKPIISDILMAWKPIAYAGIMSCGVAYTLQIVGQKNTNPTVASLILSMESVFAYLGSFLILGQKLSKREAIGSALVFIAIIIAQLPAKRGAKITN